MVTQDKIHIPPTLHNGNVIESFGEGLFKLMKYTLIFFIFIINYCFSGIYSSRSKNYSDTNTFCQTCEKKTYQSIYTNSNIFAVSTNDETNNISFIESGFNFITPDIKKITLESIKYLYAYNYRYTEKELYFLYVSMSHPQLPQKNNQYLHALCLGVDFKNYKKVNNIQYYRTLKSINLIQTLTYFTLFSGLLYYLNGNYLSHRPSQREVGNLYDYEIACFRGGVIHALIMIPLHFSTRIVDKNRKKITGNKIKKILFDLKGNNTNK